MSEQDKKSFPESAKDSLAAAGEKAKETYQAAAHKIGEVRLHPYLDIERSCESGLFDTSFCGGPATILTSLLHVCLLTHAPFYEWLPSSVEIMCRLWGV